MTRLAVLRGWPLWLDLVVLAWPLALATGRRALPPLPLLGGGELAALPAFLVLRSGLMAARLFAAPGMAMGLFFGLHLSLNGLAVWVCGGLILTVTDYVAARLV
ncbi:hypothetical protein N9W17_02425 [Jannaschia sp.]|nr:hypothetical protein [Jannaschia sp.]